MCVRDARYEPHALCFAFALLRRNALTHVVCALAWLCCAWDVCFAADTDSGLISAVFELALLCPSRPAPTTLVTLANDILAAVLGPAFERLDLEVRLDEQLQSAWAAPRWQQPSFQ